MRPRLATFTAIASTGLELVEALAEDVVQHPEVRVRSRPGHVPTPSTASYSLPAKYGGEVTTRATELSATFPYTVHLPGVSDPDGVTGGRRGDLVVVGERAAG